MPADYSAGRYTFDGIMLSVLKPQSGGAADLGEHWRRDQPSKHSERVHWGGSLMPPSPSVALPKGRCEIDEKSAAGHATRSHPKGIPLPRVLLSRSAKS